MKVLVIGNGGREHALAWKFIQSPKVSKVYVAPGNAGTELETNIENINIGVTDIALLIEFAKTNEIDLTVVGPETPLVMGIVDQFSQAGLPCFGPSQKASQLEGSKSFCKDFLARHNIPTAAYKTFTDETEAIAYIHSVGVPIVIKADGLAAGKGVIVANQIDQAINAVKDMLSANRFGEAGHRVVIEEFLSGEEASFIVIADGEHILPLATSQDHKAAFDGDKGPNTGGMGAYSPAPVVTDKVYDQIMNTIIMPTLRGMKKDGNPYTGFLYAGVMIGPDGSVKVIEYNCRFGDPETQPILMRLQSDLLALCLAALDKTLDQQQIKWDKRPALGVVMAAEGYPGSYETGKIIKGLHNIKTDDLKVFHAGTTIKNGNIITAGGRVLCAVALGTDIQQAQKKAYDITRNIHWEGVQFRKDIGYRAINND